MRYISFSTYLQKIFNERVHKITLDAGLSCPNRDGTKGKGGCIYCDSRGSGNNSSSRYKDIQSQALAGMEILSKRYRVKKFIPYFQSFCNTHAPLEKLKSMYDQVAELPGVVGLSVATRPDCLTDGVLKLLASYSNRLMVWLELGLQTSNDNTLKLINRCHNFKDFINGFTLARKYPLLLCVHVIIGLPGENRQHVLCTANKVAELKPDGIKIHSLYIHRGTALERLFLEGHYNPLEQGEFVKLACDFLELLPENTVIQRVTGDPLPGELVAPAWSLNKQKTLNMIEMELEARDSWQGKACKTSCL
jgi:hypothetical protein